MGRGEKLTERSADIDIARLVEKYGPTALLPGVDFFTLVRSAEIDATVSIYRIAGTGMQKNLTPSQWRFIKWMDDLARNDAKS